jgi:hypothetical protein
VQYLSPRLDDNLLVVDDKKRAQSFDGKKRPAELDCKLLNRRSPKGEEKMELNVRRLRCANDLFDQFNWN